MAVPRCHPFHLQQPHTPIDPIRTCADGSVMTYRLMRQRYQNIRIPLAPIVPFSLDPTGMSPQRVSHPSRAIPMSIKPSMRVLDIRCISGPGRRISQSSDAHVVGSNIEQQRLSSRPCTHVCQRLWSPTWSSKFLPTEDTFVSC